ncbi:MAG TPA: kinase [Caulobacteraceae bacterium]|jgi:D-glycerate 3-kinase
MTPAEGLAEPVAARIAAAAAGQGAPLIAGLTGAQGSGKSTLAEQLPARLAARGLRAVVLALDDLYLPKAARRRLAREVHPLLATRGVPGTHDVALGLEVLASLGRAGATRIPRFDKGADERLPPSQWTSFEGPAEVIVFEGWCVGARPQPPAALAAPVNELERTRDPDGVWRAFVNDALAGPYRALFDPIGFQALLLAPGFDVVLGWREQQEHKLIARGGPGQTDAELAVFVQNYERLTRYIAEEMPGRADVVVQLDRERRVLAIGP